MSFDKKFKGRGFLSEDPPWNDTPYDVDPDAPRKGGKAKGKKKKPQWKNYDKGQQSFGDDNAQQAADNTPSMFADQFEKIRKQIGADTPSKEVRIEQTGLAAYRAMLAMATDLMPVAEKAFRNKKTEGAVYGLSSLMNQVKDLTELIRNFSGSEEQVDYAVTKIIVPSLQRIAQQSVILAYPMKSVVDSCVKDAKSRDKIKGALDDLLNSNAQFIQATATALDEQVRAYFSGASATGGSLSVAPKGSMKTRKAAAKKASAASPKTKTGLATKSTPAASEAKERLGNKPKKGK